MASLAEIINKGKSGIITIKTAFEKLKQANPTLNDSDIGHFLDEIRTTLNMVMYNPKTRQKDYLNDTDSKEAGKIIYAICYPEYSDDFVDYTKEDLYGWLETPFYKLLADKGIDLTPPPEPLEEEQGFGEWFNLYNAIEHVNLDDAVRTVKRLNPDKKWATIDGIKKILISDSHYTDGEEWIYLGNVRERCLNAGLLFPWKDPRNPDAPANNQDTQALSQEVQTLKARITELKQANQQLTQKLADSQAEILRLQSEHNNEPLASESKPNTNTLTFYMVTDFLRAVQAVQEVFYNPDSEYLKENNQRPEQVKLFVVTDWIKQNIPIAKNNNLMAEAIDKGARTFTRGK